MNDNTRRLSAKQRILNRLMESSATNFELNDICFRYGGRIHELRAAGHRITTTAGEEPGCYIYELQIEPAAQAAA